MTNWMPTVGGFLAAFGGLLTQVDDPHWVKVAGIIIGAAGMAFLGLVAKQFNVHGGTVAQATPPTVQVQTLTEGRVMVAKEESDKKLNM